MKAIRWALGMALALVLAPTAEGEATIAGGKARASCYLVFDDIDANRGNTGFECVDGAACDADGTVNNSCDILVTACAFDGGVGGCTPQPVTRYTGPAVNKGLIELPPTGVTTRTCAAQSTVRVGPIRGKKKVKKQNLIVRAVTTGNPKSDANKIKLRCKKASTTSTTMPGCPNNPAGGPRQLTYTVADSGTDLDTGQSGISHNFPIITGASIHACLSGCDASTDSTCQATGPTGQGSLNGTTLGPPLPLFASNIAVCVINNFVDPMVQGVYDLATGTFDATATPIRLDSEVFQTNRDKVCPECRNNRCDSGPRMGAACQVEGSVRVRNDGQGVNQVYQLSSSCPPGPPQGSRTGVVSVNLPITTGVATMPGTGGGSAGQVCPGQTVHDVCNSFGTTCSVQCESTPDTKGGMNQWCCGDAQSTPCFPTAASSGEPSHTITREGAPVAATPVWPDPTYPKTANNAKVAAVFCIGDTGEPAINVVAGLPGPGAVIFNGTQTVFGNP
jgi:hypothetical protein